MNDEPLPPHAYIPGGSYPRPEDSGHHPGPLDDEHWGRSAEYLRGFRLFNAGYYWEAHEVWEGLWYAAGRAGPVADLLRGLIKFAAAGVKVRQQQQHGVVTHASRAAASFDAARLVSSGTRLLGMDLVELAKTARSLAESPPSTGSTLSDPLVRVFDFTLSPKETTALGS